MSKYPVVRDEKLIWSIDPTAKFVEANVFLSPDEKRRVDACMVEFHEVQLMLTSKVAEAKEMVEGFVNASEEGTGRPAAGVPWVGDSYIT